jgi:hypothetical protein
MVTIERRLIKSKWSFANGYAINKQSTQSKHIIGNVINKKKIIKGRGLTPEELQFLNYISILYKFQSEFIAIRYTSH